MDKEQMTRILGSAIQAPSGENSQPWNFVVKDQSIEVWNVPDRDQSLYNWEQCASYMANGAAVENIVLAAREEGLNATVNLFPDKGRQNLVAEVFMEKGTVEKDGLYPFISERCTNRKAYKSTPLSDQEIHALTNCSSSAGVKRVLYTQDPANKKLLGTVSSINEKILFSNPELHQFFFKHVNWTLKEDEEKKKGFFIDTLELSPPDKMMFGLLKHWPVTRFLNKLGVHQIIGKKNAGLYSSAAGFGILTLGDSSPGTFAEAGRAMQRVWLTATKLNLSLQPVGGVLFFMGRVRAGSTEKFTASQLDLIKSGYGDIVRAFGVEPNEIIGFMFRIGHGGQPTARASRYALKEVSNLD